MATFAIERSAPGRLVARGELSFETAADALRAGLQLFDGGDCSIDLAGVSHGDSAGLAVLIEWLAHARQRGIALRYEHVPAQITAIARISDVDDLLTTA